MPPSPESKLTQIDGHQCEYCGAQLVRHSISHWKSDHQYNKLNLEAIDLYKKRRFCGKSCSAQMRIWQTWERELILQVRGECTVPRCVSPKGHGLRFLCTHHHLNSSDVPQFHYGNLNSAAFKMEEKAAEWSKDHERLHVKQVTSEHHTQAELEYFLKWGVLPTDM
ncbi:MAG: hypothetical protein KAJ19_14290 [Gammaproteobacteria bacterium]|nr:hypothetical protein [Gammaproteobacteria bacterium]